MSVDSPPAVGVSLPTSFASGVVSMAELASLAERAEELGFAAVSCGDHLLWHSAMLDPLLTLASLVGATDRVALMTGVLLAPLRHPLWLAKQVGTLQHLSGGRLVLGMGVGGELPEEFAAAGVDLTRRGRVMESTLDRLEGIWTTQDDAARVEVDGQRFALTTSHPRPPVWLGGSSEAAMDRVARRADGLLAIFVRPDRIPVLRRDLGARVEQQGRDVADVGVGVQVFVCADTDATRGARRVDEFVRGHFGSAGQGMARQIVLGDVEAIRAALDPYVDAGVDFLQAHIVGDRPEITLEAVAEAVEPLLPATGVSGMAPTLLTAR